MTTNTEYNTSLSGASVAGTPEDTAEIRRLEELIRESRSAEKPDKRHSVIFIAALITAALFTLCFKGRYVMAGASCLLFFNALGIAGLAVLKLTGMLKRKASIVLILPIFALSCFNAYFEYSYYNIFNCMAFFVLLTTMLLYCSGVENKLCMDAFLNIIFNRMLHGTGLAARSVFIGKKFNAENIIKTFLGAVCSIPIIAVISQLLLLGDDAFYDTVESIAVNFDTADLIWTLAVFGCIFVFFCGYFYRFLEKEPRITFNGLVTDNTIATAFLTPVNLLFLFFCYSQLSYLGKGSAITEFTTYSSFAHEGFFLLLIVTFINFSIILAFTDILKAQTKGRLKYSLLLLCMFTFLLIISCFYRMYLYMAAYGFTPLRIEVVSFLAVESILVFTTMVSISRGRTDIIQDFVIAAVIALMTLNFTARPEFSAKMNAQLGFSDISESCGTHSSIPLLIEKYSTAADTKERSRIAEKIDHLYDAKEYSEVSTHWQSFSIQRYSIQKAAAEFFEDINKN